MTRVTVTKCGCVQTWLLCAVLCCGQLEASILQGPRHLATSPRTLLLQVTSYWRRPGHVTTVLTSDWSRDRSHTSGG